jgi:fructose-1,6-bisphosphatase
MGKVIEWRSVKHKKNKEEAQKVVDQIHTAKTAIAMILGKLEVGLLEGSLAMQILVNKIIEDQEWDKETFDIAASEYKVVINSDNNEELH